MKDFEKIIWGDSLTLFDFFATWCAPCQAMLPAIDQFRDAMRGRIDVYKIDIDDPNMREVIRRYKIATVPTLLFFRRGEMLHRQSGRTDFAQLKQILNQLEAREQETV